MSNVEHLIENAIDCLDRGQSFEDFLSYKFNKDMLKMVKSPAEEIWEMAIYVKYTHDESLKWELEEEIEKKYGYPIPDSK
mgnify:CR=1 FL=1